MVPLSEADPSEADTISISPSPSISAANTDLAVSAFVAISAAVKEAVPPNMATLVTTPVMEIVGVAVMASLNVAVIVTVSDAAKKLSESESVSVTVGAVESNLIVILSDPA